MKTARDQDSQANQETVTFLGCDSADDIRWDQVFSRSPETLAQLAAIAMAEHCAGKTQELNPETLHLLSVPEIKKSI